MADDNGAAGLSALQRLLDERTTTIKRMGTKILEAKRQARDFQSQRDAIAAERDAVKVAAAKALTESEVAIRVENERLKAELRIRDHRSVFDRVAKDRGCPDDSLDFLFGTSGYKAEADQPDESAIAKHIDNLKDKPGFARIFGAAETPVSHAPPPGTGQGGRHVAAGKWKVTTDQLRDGAWTMANAAKLAQARKEGTLEIVD